MITEELAEKIGVTLGRKAANAANRLVRLYRNNTNPNVPLSDGLFWGGALLATCGISATWCNNYKNQQAEYDLMLRKNPIQVFDGSANFSHEKKRELWPLLSDEQKLQLINQCLSSPSPDTIIFEDTHGLIRGNEKIVNMKELSILFSQSDTFEEAKTKGLAADGFKFTGNQDYPLTVTLTAKTLTAK